jgi:hypothetical protein
MASRAWQSDMLGKAANDCVILNEVKDLAEGANEASGFTMRKHNSVQHDIEVSMSPMVDHSLSA